MDCFSAAANRAGKAANVKQEPKNKDLSVLSDIQQLKDCSQFYLVVLLIAPQLQTRLHMSTH